MSMFKTLKLGINGVIDGLLYHHNHVKDRHMHPTFLVFQLTNMCNSHCVMCGIWKKPVPVELNIREIRKIFKSELWSRLRWINLTGGEPFLRKDFLHVIHALDKLPKLEGIAIPSNGFLTDRIVESVKKTLHILGKKRFLSVTLSIDGFEETHDKIRGTPGAYQKVLKTLEKLKELKKRHKNFNVGVQPTISKWNVDEIEEFYRFMKTKIQSIGFAVTLTSEGYYDNADKNIELTAEDKKKIAAFFRKVIKEDPQYGYYYMKLIELFQTGKRRFICLAGFITLFMDPYGNMFPCPVLSYGKKYYFGNAKEGPLEVWFSDEAKAMKKRLKTERVCDRCSMMCDFINVAKAEFFDFTSFMLQHPGILARLLKKINTEENPYF